MTYGDAITYLVKNKYIFKAIRDLSECAEILMLDVQKNADELRAEKRTIKRFLASDMDELAKIDAISSLLEEEA